MELDSNNYILHQLKDLTELIEAIKELTKAVKENSNG